MSAHPYFFLWNLALKRLFWSRPPFETPDWLNGRGSLDERQTPDWSHRGSARALSQLDPKLSPVHAGMDAASPLQKLGISQSVAVEPTSLDLHLACLKREDCKVRNSHCQCDGTSEAIGEILCWILSVHWSKMSHLTSLWGTRLHFQQGPRLGNESLYSITFSYKSTVTRLENIQRRQDKANGVRWTHWDHLKKRIELDETTPQSWFWRLDCRGSLTRVCVIRRVNDAAVMFKSSKRNLWFCDSTSYRSGLLKAFRSPCFVSCRGCGRAVYCLRKFHLQLAFLHKAQL